MNIIIFTADSNGGYPVPATKGGAVSTLIEHLVYSNNNKKLFDMTIVSLYDEDAEERSMDYHNIHFQWINVPKFIKYMDRFFFFIISRFYKNKKAISYRSIFSLLYYIHKSKNILKKDSFDYVILENNIPLAWIIKLSNYKGLYAYHLHNIPRIDARCRSVFAECNKFLCVSKYVGDAIAKKGSAIGIIPESKIRVLYNCIDTNKFNSDINSCNYLTRRGYGLKDSDFVIIFVGRMTWEKGIDKLLDAVSTIRDNDIKVLIVGSYTYGLELKDAYQTYLHEKAKELGNRIIFTGYISQENLPEVYHLADMAVLPSMWEEPAGLTNLEAMSCGLPVITTDAGGIPEYVENAAIIIKRDSNIVKNIADNIVKIKNNKKLSNSYSALGIKKVNEKFTLDIYLDKFAECLK